MPSEQVTILVIDDEEAVRSSIADYLEDLDFDLLTAENGRIGVETFNREKVDMVLVDLRMPEMDGIEVLQTISRTNPEIPLIVVSGTGVISDALDALHQGAWDYVLKPVVDFSVLLHAIQTNLEKARLKKENLQYQQHLEEMVADRTSELERVNKHLTNINIRLRNIVETTRKLSFCSEVKAFGSQLLDEFVEHMQARGGTLYLLEEKGLRLLHAIDPGYAPSFVPFPLPEKAIFNRIIEDGKPLLFENIVAESASSGMLCNQYQDGSVLIFPLPDESGRISAILTLHNEISTPFVEQDKEIGTILASYSCEALRAVKASEELRRNERQFRSILDNMRTGITIVDIETRKIAYVNPATAEITGSSIDELIGHRCHDTLCPCKEGNCKVLDLGLDINSVEQVLKTQDGKEIPILKTVTPIFFKGRNCLLESFQDLTTQKEILAEKELLEKQLHHVQRIEAIGTLAGGIAHDFNNILSVIIGNTDLAILEAFENRQSAGHLEQIQKAATRAADLVRQILTISRQRELDTKPVYISSIVKDIVKMLRATLPTTINIVSKIDNNSGMTMADPTQIHQILMNLATNAAHAMRENGGVLSLELKNVNLDDALVHMGCTLDPGAYVKLTVSDTGHGIEAAILERIFDPYYTTKSPDEGTGLGLAVVMGIVKKFGGAVSVESEPGRGTRFDLLFPIVDNESAPEQPKHASIELPKGNENILIVDDEEQIADIGSSILKRLGYSVTVESDSTGVLRRFREDPNQFDLVISDVTMPKMPGDELARELLGIRPEMPIILCSGFTTRITEKEARSMGIREYLVKPIQMEALATAVRRALDR